MSFVLDNSVALSWCFADEQSPPAMALLNRLIETGASAPMLWPLEASNGLLMAERRGRVTPAQRRQLMSFLAELPIALDHHTAEQAWLGAAELAERFKLTIYDAAYLELAQRRRLPLATVDRALLAAANAAQVPIVS